MCDSNDSRVGFFFLPFIQNFVPFLTTILPHSTVVDRNKTMKDKRITFCSSNAVQMAAQGSPDVVKISRHLFLLTLLIYILYF